MSIVIYTSNGAIMVRNHNTDVPIHDWPKYRSEVRSWLHEQLPPPYPLRLELSAANAVALLARLGIDAQAL